MKKGWQSKTLGEIGKVSMCKRIFKEETTASGDIPFYKIGTFGKEPDAFIPNQTYNEYRAKYPFPKKGDVLISASGTIGRRVRYDGEPAYFQDSNIVWIDNDEEQVLNDYLFHFYEACEWNSTKGATISRLYNDDLRRITLGFPKSLQEQRRIVGILDEAFAGIATAKANAEKNLQNARALFESHLNAVFTRRGDGWAEDQLDALTEPDSPITYGVVKPGPEGEIRFVRGGDLVRGKIRMNELRTITCAISNQYRRTLLRGGELLICLVGQPGQVAVAPRELAGSNIARQVGLIRLKKSMNAEFVRYYLQAGPGAEALGARESGSVQQVINLGELRHVSVPHPKLGEQNEIVEKLDQIAVETQRLESSYQRKLAVLDELKKSLLYQAFSGEL